MDKKGILVYLLTTYGLTFIGVPLMLHLGLLVYEEPNILNNIVFLLLMWIPALGALIAAKAVPNPAFKRAPWWPVAKVRAIRIALVVLAAYVLTYGVTTACGWTVIQWDMSTMMVQINGMLQQPLKPSVEAIVPAILIVGGLFLSVVLGLTVFAALALGSELGWRGFLLPRLMPLGRFRAYAVVGILWGLWFLPFIYGWHRDIQEVDKMWITVLEYLAMGMALSAFLGEIWRHTGHLGLAAVGLGSFCSHLQGIWEHLFQIPKAPWAGPFGIVAIVVWAVIALLPVLANGREKDASPPPSREDAS